MKGARTAAKTMGARDWALLVLLSVLWGGAFFFGEIALAELPPFSVALLRVGIAAMVLSLAVRIAGHRMPSGAGPWAALFVMGGLNNLIPFSLILWGQTQIASGLASIINATTPLFSVVLAHVLTGDEKMTGNRLGGVLLGLAGVAVLIGGEALRGLGGQLAAQAAILGAALSYSLAAIYGRRFRASPPLVTAAGQVSASAIMGVPLVLIVDRPWTLALPGFSTWSAILAIAILSTALAYVIYFRLLATAGPTNLLLVTFLIPVSAIALGVTFLGEHLEANQVWGMALIGLGLAAIDGRALRYVLGRAGRQGNSAPPKSRD